MDDKWEFLKYLPEIIRAAAADRLGILALLIIATALIGFFFFRRSRLWLRATTLGVFALGTAAFGTAAIVRTSAGLTVEREYIIEGPIKIAGPLWEATLSRSIVAPNLSNRLVRLEQLAFEADVGLESAELFGFDIEVLQFSDEVDPLERPQVIELVGAKDRSNLGSRLHVVFRTDHKGRVPGSRTPVRWSWHAGQTQHSETLDIKPRTNGPAETLDGGLQTQLMIWTLWGYGREAAGKHEIVLRNIHLKLKMRVWPVA